MAHNFKRMPFILGTTPVDLDLLMAKLYAPKTPRDQYFADMFKDLVAAVRKGSDGNVNTTAAAVAALALSRMDWYDDFTAEMFEAAYKAVEWCIGMRWLDWDDLMKDFDMDEDLLAEYQAPHEPSVKAQKEYIPGVTLGRPPKSYVRSFGGLRKL